MNALQNKKSCEHLSYYNAIASQATTILLLIFDVHLNTRCVL